MSRSQPLRLGFFSYLEGHQPAAEVYAEALDVFVAADGFGYDVAWVAQHHFAHHGGLPSPFVFFAALAERTRTIAVGTAVVTLPLEHPVRLAEDAAVFETLYPNRLHLGVGTGFATPAVLATFDRAGADRRALYDGTIDRLLAALAGEAVNDDGDVVHPAVPALRERIWEAPSTPERAREAGRRGSGLLLSRIAIGAGDRPSYELQAPIVEQYLAALPAAVAPRIGLSRTVYPSHRRDVALGDLNAGLDQMLAGLANQGQAVPDISREALFAHHNIHFGSPEAVVETLSREPLLDQVTDLICQVQPGLPSRAQTLDAVELIATVVAPALGWKPAHERLAVAA
jgi:alkanesulfonate monooxygenase SsuD/methylene tetrahydromethanopterin reductase-like flavin-dependent oxidoreductase (luciferase family)